jgi:hypothetical protein
LCRPWCGSGWRLSATAVDGQGRCGEFQVMARIAHLTVRLLGSALMTAALAGCNTVMRGTEETVTITTRPASARIWTSLGQGCPQSPCTVRVDRKTEFTAHAAARGYQPGSLVVSSKLTSQAAPGVIGNAIIPGGSVGLVVDVATGAMLDHTPNPAHIDLVPIKRARRARRCTGCNT